MYSVGSNSTDPLITTLWTWSSVSWIHCKYANNLSQSSTWRRCMTRLGDSVSWGRSTGRICGIDSHFLSRTFPRIFISMFVLAMSGLHVMLKKNGMPQGSGLSVTLFKITINGIVSAAGHLSHHSCRWCCNLLQFPGAWQQQNAGPWRMVFNSLQQSLNVYNSHDCRV